MGRNIVKLKKNFLMESSLIRKYDFIIFILMSRQLKKWKVFIVSLFFGWIKLKFGVRGNSGLLISNLNSKLSYEPVSVLNLKKATFLLIDHDF